MRRPIQLLAVVLAASFGVQPAHADDAQKGIRVGAQYTAVITSTATMSAAQSGRATPAGFEAVASCGYVAELTGGNRMIVELVGDVTGVGPTATTMTWVNCEISNSFGQRAVSQFACGGNACATATVASGWHVGAISVCVSAQAWYLNMPSSQEVRIERTCESVV